MKKRKTIIINYDRHAYIADVELIIQGASVFLSDIRKLGLKVDGGVIIPLKPAQEKEFLGKINVMDYI